MGLSQGNFDRATQSADGTLRELIEHTKNKTLDLSKTNVRRLQVMHHDLEQIQTAIRMEMMNRAGH